MWSRSGSIADQLTRKYGLDREMALRKYLENRYLPLGLGEPVDVAHAIAFLASPVSKRITFSALDIGGTIRGLL